MKDSSTNCTETIHVFAAEPVVRQALDEYSSWCKAVADHFRTDPLSDYPRNAKHAVISLFLEEKRRVATLCMQKAKDMSGGDKTSCFWGSYLWWCDAMSTIEWLDTQLNHAKQR